MCGICGLVRSDPARPIDAAALQEMRDLLSHRGPDDSGIWIDEGVGLGHRRLAIIDLSAAVHLPMSNEDRSIWVTYNGEIYNYRELRRRLEGRGHVFSTRTDTEVLVHLYEERGADLVEDLRGMFAFAIWDVPRRQLLLARDRLGIKPLYYTITSSGDLAFGSEIKAVLASGLVRAELNPAALSEYLANRYTTGSDTLYAGVRRLEPGRILRWRAGSSDMKTYWSYPNQAAPSERRSEADWLAEFQERFVETVRLRMISDAPIGVFLSGGLDSSAIAATMARESSAPIKTFSVAFAAREANELAYAREVAEHLDSDHHEVLVSPDDFFNEVPRLIWHEDEPLAFPSNVPLYFVSRLAADSVKVVLTGDGSDELLAGYGKYWRTLYNRRIGQLYSHLPASLRDLANRYIDKLPNHPLSHKLRRTCFYLPGSIESLYLENFGVFNGALQRRLLTPEFLETVEDDDHSIDPFGGHRRVLASFKRLPELEKLLAVDTQTYLQELLMKQDQMSMAASIESRVPFLDHEFVEFTARLPRKLKLRGFATKRILRKSMRGVLPPSILSRRKMGFPTPLGSWLRGDFTHLLDEILLTDRARERGLFNARFVEKLIAEHRSGAADHTERLWALMNLEWWLSTCIDHRPVFAYAD